MEGVYSYGYTDNVCYMSSSDSGLSEIMYMDENRKYPSMENVYEEIVSPCERLKISSPKSSVRPDDPYPISKSKVKKTLKVLQSEEPPSSSMVIMMGTSGLFPKANKGTFTRGQLKISAYMNFGLLTVHVVQARHLQSKWKPLCNSFVKMSLVPDDSRKSRCKTEMIIDSNNPLFDEKFSFELLEEDYSKRLMISVWHRDQGGSSSEFLGCMSFGIRHLLNPKKDVSGWYYLLTEEIGRKKHLQVSYKEKPQLRMRNQVNTVPPVNKDVWGMEPMTVTVHRGKHGYGFSVIESCPVKVGRVDRASPAEAAGLQPGDCVVRVNSQNVSRSQAVSVAKLVKSSGTTLVIEIQRSHRLDTLEKSPWKQTFDGPFEQMDMRAGIDARDSSEAEVSEEYKENEISVDEGLLGLPSNLITSTPLPLFCNGHQTVLTAERRKQEAIHRLLSVELDFIDFMHAGMQRFSRPLRHCILNPKQHSALFQNIEKVVTISEYHVKQINDNRPSMLSSDTDMSTCSESNQNFVNSIGMIYQSKVHMLCQAYDLYAKGLDEANNVLCELRKNQEFMKFIKDPLPDPNQPSIAAFICRPVQHINDLYQVLREVFTNTQSDSQDYSGLKHLAEALQECHSNINNYSCVARVQSFSSLTTSSSGSQTSCHRSSSSSSSSSSDTSSTHSRRTALSNPYSLHSSRPIDTEVARIQDRLHFPSHVQAFNLGAEDRHLIYASDLFRWEGKQWVKIYALLFSDMLLETECDRDGQLRVYRDPLLLRDVCGVEGHRKHTTELVVHMSARKSSVSSKLLYRAPDAEQKFTWKSLLEQRIYATTGTIEHYSSAYSDSSASSSAVII